MDYLKLNPIAIVATEVIDSILKNLNSLITTDKERAKTKALLLQELNRFGGSLIEEYKAESMRVKDTIPQADLAPSWLTQNIRPLVLLILVVFFGTFSLIQGFSKGLSLPPEVMESLRELVVTAIGFYFGGRTIEKLIPLAKRLTK
jgi:hypothetical protein